MLRNGKMFRGRAYVNIRGSWYLLVTVANRIDKIKELKTVV